VTPYVGQSIIIAAVTILLVFIALEKTQWGLLWAVGLVWALFALYVIFFGVKYRIFWDEDGLTMSASGGPNRSISFDEITEVRRETARADEFLSQARPLRRLVIVGSQHAPNARIDISLRHFRTPDIDRLIREIGERRPDLTLPKQRRPAPHGSAR
jgi:hypothetical protein